MVLIGISVLVASISFLVYRHPPTSWSSIYAFLFRLWPGRRLEEPGGELGRPDARRGGSGDLTVHRTVPEESQKDTTGPRSVPESTIALAPQTNSQAALKPPHASPSVPLLSLDESSSSDDDSAPSFPSKYSAQRASPLLSSDHSLQTLQSKPQNHHPVQATGGIPMAPPPRPSSSYNSMRTRPSPTALSLPAPIGAATIPTRSGGNSLTLPPTATQKPPKPRKKVLLAPGHSPLDWARLQASGADLRGLPYSHLLKVPPSQLRLHNMRTSAWTVLGGKVYNITPYLPYHPGGERELMKAAGRDGTKLFMEIHPWVNWDTMLGACLIGMAADENPTARTDNHRAGVGIVGEKWEDID
ncbi:MAG: hypothetical protein M1840_004714 [Geoglossum simile]|nr:MAG: hypothetical protein M1840_004714 [Geoglossum simile]